MDNWYLLFGTRIAANNVTARCKTCIDFLVHANAACYRFGYSFGHFFFHFMECIVGSTTAFTAIDAHAMATARATEYHAERCKYGINGIDGCRFVCGIQQ